MKSMNGKKPVRNSETPVGRALRRGAKVARKIARMHGTPICVWQDGKVVVQKP
jgi:hypothetical protein